MDSQQHAAASHTTPSLQDIRGLLSSGIVPVNEEVNFRSYLAFNLIQSAPHAGASGVQLIREAIENLEIILRRVTGDSPDRLKYLDELSYARSTEYQLTNSRRALELAVRHSRQARELAINTNLSERDNTLYCSILNNLGYALSYLNALEPNMAIMDESLACGREYLAHTTRGSPEHIMGSCNLASRLRNRHVQLKADDWQDLEEALSLCREVLELSEVGSQATASAHSLIGTITSTKYRMSQDIAHLDEGIFYLKISIAQKSGPHENHVGSLLQLCHLYQTKYARNKNRVDFHELITHRGMLADKYPHGHPEKSKYMRQYFQELLTLVVRHGDTEYMDSLLDDAYARLMMMPQGWTHQTDCQGMLCAMLGRKYVLTHKLEHLLYTFEYLERVSIEYNERASFTEQPQMDHRATSEIVSSLKSIIESPSGSAMRIFAEAKLPNLLEACFQRQDSEFGAICYFQDEYAETLNVMAKAARGSYMLTEDEIEEEVSKLKRENDASSDDEGGTIIRSSESNYQTLTGHRSLAIDPQNRRVILDLSGLVEDILGYDPTKPTTREEMRAREARLEEESLKKSLDAGAHPNPRLCYMCRYHTYLRPTENGLIMTKSRHILPHGTWHQLECRGKCAICSLLLSMITLGKKKDGLMLHPTFNEVDPEIQGLGIDTAELCSGETLLQIRYAELPLGHVRIVTSENYQQALRQGWQLGSGSRPEIAIDDLQGPLRDISRQEVNIDKLKSWLELCDRRHSSVCHYYRCEKRADTDIPLIFVDVIKRCLVSATSAEKYLALSYTWGKVEMSETRKANYSERLRPGTFANLSKVVLPQTVADAILLVEKLGERYLWVDSLCIVQDDMDQKAREIPRMDIVYGKAFATIIALSGVDANSGLPGLRGGTREPQQLEKLTVSNGSLDLDYDPKAPDSANVSCVLVNTPRPLYMAIAESRWSTRGWVMQERLLSRRCLYFSHDAVYFQCSEETICEVDVGKTIEDDPEESHWHLLKSLNHDNPLDGLEKLYELFMDERIHKVFATYSNLISKYTQKMLTSKSDILDAFGGMSAVLGQYIDGKMNHGLPEPAFAHALLWTPCGRNPRRGCRLDWTSSSLDMGEPEKKFPSWSWSGWDGSVEYRLFTKVDGSVEIPRPSVRSFEVVNSLGTEIIEVADYKPKLWAETPLPSKYAIADEHQKAGPASAGLEGGNRAGVGTALTVDPKTNRLWVVYGPPPRNPNVASKEKKTPHNVLRFKGLSVPLPSFQISSRKQYLSTQQRVHQVGSQAVRDIVTKNGKHCGLWWEQAGYGYVGLGIDREAESKFIMVEISRFGDAYVRREGPYRVEGDIPVFDSKVFPQTGPCSGLVNLLVVDLDTEHAGGIGDRCTVAMIHRAAWEAAGPVEREVKIA